MKSIYHKFHIYNKKKRFNLRYNILIFYSRDKNDMLNLCLLSIKILFKLVQNLETRFTELFTIFTINRCENSEQR